jgi:hypothetical protein
MGRETMAMSLDQRKPRKPQRQLHRSSRSCFRLRSGIWRWPWTRTSRVKVEDTCQLPLCLLLNIANSNTADSPAHYGYAAYG